MDLYDTNRLTGGMRCSLCRKLLKNQDVKFLVSSAELHELFLPVEKRHLCLRCYSGISPDGLFVSEDSSLYPKVERLEAG
jgi:hypothetical protein